MATKRPICSYGGVLEELRTGDDLPGTGGADAMPPGGSTGQVLRKASTADYDTEWVTPTGDSSVTMAISNADVTVNNSTTFVDVPGCEVTLAEGSYVMQLGGYFTNDSASSVTAALRIAAGTAVLGSVSARPAHTNSTTFVNPTSANLASIGITNTASNGILGSGGIVIRTAGTVKLRFAPTTTVATNLTCKAGATIRFIKVG